MANLASEISSIDFGSIIGGSLNAVVNAQSESAKTTINFIRNIGFEQGEKQADGTSAVGKPVYVSFKYPKEIMPYVPKTDTTYAVEVISSGAAYDGLPLQFNAGTTQLACRPVFGADGGITSVVLDAPPTGITQTTEITIALNSNTEAASTTATLPTSNTARLRLVVTQGHEAKPAIYQDMKIDVPLLTMVPIPFIKIANADIEFNVKINSVSNTAAEEKEDKSGSLAVEASGGCSFFRASAKLNASFSNQKSTSSSEKIERDYSLNIKVHAVQDDMPAGIEKMLNILEETIITKIA